MDTATTTTTTAAPAPVAPPTAAQTAPTTQAAPPATSSASLLAPDAAPTPIPGESTDPTVNGAPQVKDWMKDFPDDLKGEASLSLFNDVQSLAKSFVHAQKTIGKDKVVLPDQHASEEDWNKFYQKVGLPETVENYKVELPKDSKYLSEEAITELKSHAHKLGVLPKQLSGILGWYEKRAEAISTQLAEGDKTKVAENINSLKQEWGESFSTRIAWAKRLMDENKVEGLDEYRNDMKYGSNPTLIKLLSKIGENLYKEDTIRGGGDNARFVMTPAQAQERINTIMSDGNHPYFNPEHANNKTAIEEVKSLYEIAHYKPS